MPFQAASVMASRDAAKLSRAFIFVVYHLFLYKMHIDMDGGGIVGDRRGAPGMLVTFEKGEK